MLLFFFWASKQDKETNNWSPNQHTIFKPHAIYIEAQVVKESLIIVTVDPNIEMRVAVASGNKRTLVPVDSIPPPNQTKPNQTGNYL